MKYRLYLTLCLLIALLSCNDWLDVQPKTAIKGDKLFQSEAGFIDALTAFYLKMGSTSLYGKELTYGFLDYLSANYDNYPDFKGGKAELMYDYGGIWESKKDDIFISMYNIIANINNFLSYLDEKGEIVKTENYREIMKGEAIGLRGFLHLELLRIFGPVIKSGENPVTLVYRDKFTKEKEERLLLFDYLNRIEQDLLDAHTYLQEVDPLLFGVPDSWSSDFNSFTYQRQLRFNLYAVKATLARLYALHTDSQSKEKAVTYATEVIESEVFPLLKKSGNQIYYPENIFALHIYELDKILNQHFNTDVVDDNTSIAAHIYIKQNNFQMLYEMDKGGATDIRCNTDAFKEVVENGKSCMYCLKYRQDIYRDSYNGQEIIPLIRIPEMYYIVAECAVDPILSAEALNTVRWARGIPIEDEIIPDQSYDSPDQREGYNAEHTIRINELTSEYQKEFFAEGKLFYFYKKHNFTTYFRAPLKNVTDKYQIPVPDDEISFGKN